ncbi:tRNA pseudouridine(38/39) synthase isoform X3 [Macadamia integrifolia]|uniref:tRNA pseudouridine(38/39) synthase isoform X3 n=1 Tax=Macadamia integrifolia TaxID=60698 RepID=UPI001C4F0714|nr:tRNA pseudouridine(38/39) synthase isoform X3 [Macadamia integrifolia]
MAGREGVLHSEVFDPQIERLEGEDLMIELQSQLKSLRSRVKELELENARLSQLSNCRCQKIQESPELSAVSSDISVEDIAQSTAGVGIVGVVLPQEHCREEGIYTRGKGGTKTVDVNKKKKSKEETIAGCDTGIMRHHARRYVALKIMYFGQRFHGFSLEGQMDPTVESEFFKALKQTKLLIGEREELQYSRCGRTDKGVSSVGQVVSLFLRSNLKDIKFLTNYEENAPKERCEEIDYVRVLNRVLPKDIRVISWCPAPIDLHARFSCLSREYKYLFWRENLDISAMEVAGKKFIGEHDFRNFCKMDAVNVHNYKRNILSFEISSCNERSEDDQIWAMTIKGSSFLWHQVRCMVAVLFMIGEGLESPSVIDILLDTSKTLRKPQYVMAPELPLILYSCEFHDLSFVCSPDAKKTLYEHLKHEFQNYRLKASIFHTALLSCSSAMTDRSPLGYAKKKKAVHVPLMSRPTEPSYEERRAKLKSRK